MNDKPLSGVRVADFTNMLMAPYTTQILGDMGADVVKVEAPGGDPIRLIGPQRNPGMGAIFLNTNRSKRSIVLDLKRPPALEAARRLIGEADVLVYNRRPPVMERLGLSYEAVREINPRIIYAGLFGYGQNGPYSHKPAFDDLIQGAVAIPSMMRRPEDDGHRYVPIALVDRGVGLWAVGQITSALYYRERTGRGQRIDMPKSAWMPFFNSLLEETREEFPLGHAEPAHGAGVPQAQGHTLFSARRSALPRRGDPLRTEPATARAIASDSRPVHLTRPSMAAPPS